LTGCPPPAPPVAPLRTPNTGCVALFPASAITSPAMRIC
jgi:hypothetical protein